MHLNARLQRGVTLIELMIGLVVGLIVIGAVSSFTVATLRAGNENVQSSRLTQDLRTAMTLVSREIRRSGYDSAAVERMGTGTAPSNYTALTVSNGCLAYQYNRAGNQFRAIRISDGALEMATATAAITDCNGGGNWTVITDPDVVAITGFAPTETREVFSTIVGMNVVGADTEVLAGCGQVRNISIDITGSLVADASISRKIHEEIRVRADPLRFLKRTYNGISTPASTVPTAAEEAQLLADCQALL